MARAMVYRMIVADEKNAASRLRWRLICAGIEAKMYARVGIYRMPVTCRDKLVVFDVDPGVAGNDVEVARRKKRNAWLETAGVEVIHVFSDDVDTLDLEPIKQKSVPDRLVAQVTGRLAAWAGKIPRHRNRKAKGAGQKNGRHGRRKGNC